MYVEAGRQLSLVKAGMTLHCRWTQPTRIGYFQVASI